MKMVKIRLPKAGKNEEKDVFVGVNGVGYRILKGVEVEVPASVAEVLRNSEGAKDQCLQFLEDRNNLD